MGVGTLPLKSVMEGAVNTTMKCDDVGETGGRQQQHTVTHSTMWVRDGTEGGGKTWVSTNINQEKWLNAGIKCPDMTKISLTVIILVGKYVVTCLLSSLHGAHALRPLPLWIPLSTLTHHPSLLGSCFCQNTTAEDSLLKNRFVCSHSRTIFNMPSRNLALPETLTWKVYKTESLHSHKP